MTRFDDDSVLRSALASARDLRPTEAEVDVALKRTPKARLTQAPNFTVVVLAAVLALSTIVYAVPSARAAIEDLTGMFAGWVDGDDSQQPGRTLRPDNDAPEWVRSQGGRLIAENGPVGLYVARTSTSEGVQLNFALDEGVVIGDSVEGWRGRFDEHAIVVLGPTPVSQGRLTDAQGRFPLLGVTARSVDRVEARYLGGGSVTFKNAQGGFVLLVDAWRPLHELVAYDASDRVLERVDISHIDMRHVCPDQDSCQSDNPSQP